MQDRLEKLLECPVRYVGLSGWTTEQFARTRVRAAAGRAPLVSTVAESPHHLTAARFPLPLQNDSNLGSDLQGRPQHGLEKMMVDALVRLYDL